MSARQLLLFGGIALAILGMTYGLWYAVFVEHQALDGIGMSLTSGFQAAAQRNPGDAERALLQYRRQSITTIAKSMCTDTGSGSRCC